MLTFEAGRVFKVVMNKFRYIKLFVMLVLFVLMLTTLHGQDLRMQFDSMKRAHQTGYNQFVEQADQEFADFLRKNWQSFEVHSGHVFTPKPKPTEIPKSGKVQPKVLELKLDEPVPIEIFDELVMPVNYKSSLYLGTPKSAYFDFYGDQVVVNYDSSFDFDLASGITRESVAAFWEEAARSDYRGVLDQLLALKQSYSLNDFGYYLLVKRFCEHTQSTVPIQRLSAWFILAKSKYKVKIGFNKKEVHLMLPCRQKVYGKNYFMHNGQPFYVMDFIEGQLFSYQSDYPGAYLTMDFSFTKPLVLKDSVAMKEVNFHLEDKKYQFELAYNLNAIELYQAIPPIELEGYFNAQLSALSRNSILKSLAPVVQDMDEYQAVSFLLGMVQNGFDYQIDEEQFGYEKAFFPEEMLHFSFSDCEDRAVFFAYLVENLIGRKVIGLDYPSHVATAVNFSEDVAGDYYMYNGKKYVVCDPTYVNAPIGVSMNDMLTSDATVIQKETDEWSWASISRLLNNLGIGGEVSVNGTVSSNTGRTVSVRHQQGFYTAGQETITADRSVIALGTGDELQWMKSFLTSDEVMGITRGNGDESYVLLEQPGQRMLVRISASGEMDWEKEIAEAEPALEGANHQIVVYSTEGNQLAGKTYAETAYFSGDPLAFRNGNILVSIPIYKRAVTDR